ncbi:FAD:protein FMN transferase [Kitasatospora sp. MAP5-34]|uniref:FAD:protein FMN transferase n=1 Tax=Kitasatospora sp. MAP5-34 TaxID=3035102 RepID=UPI00247453E8|nr:FAD:protein FMN transferase [Kitasatospora sp. MAP5-34]MDH6577748.1 thiamine biosynthesis lipoprotein [Kitasatospora sp. MAP5-34]
MTVGAAGPVTVAFPALGTTAVLVVTDPAALDAARQVLEAELAAIDLACSRFRPDSELSRANAAAGKPVTVSPLFAEALETALRAAELTDGVVDPTVGTAVAALGYDRTFASVRPEGIGAVTVVRPAGRRSVGWEPGRRRLLLPLGTALDFGATAKALAADRAAGRAARAVGCGVLVGLGGDLSTAGPAPAAGWQVEIADHHAESSFPPGPTVALHTGGLASSGTTARTWRRGGRTLHHIVDPATGDVPSPVWRTVSVAAASCVDANTASTAAVVLGEKAPGWLGSAGLPARLVRTDGSVLTLGGWPADPPARTPDQGGPG